ELSSAGCRKPVGEEYPAPPLLRRFIDQGVPLTTASDAHSLPDVADRVDDLRDLLVAAGVSRLQGFRNRKPYEPAGPADCPQVVQAFQSGEASRGEQLLEAGEEPVRLHSIPVRCEGTTVAVLARLSARGGRAA